MGLRVLQLNLVGLKTFQVCRLGMAFPRGAITADCDAVLLTTPSGGPA